MMKNEITLQLIGQHLKAQIKALHELETLG